MDLYRRLENKPTGKLVLVTAITPTPAGEGKTTTSIGLCDGLNRIGKKATVCLREPSLGPCFGMKGGAAGGGYAQVVPMEDINLHFTGDFHAIELAHNLLAALLDNHLHHGNKLNIDPRRIVWKRVVDMNDRALRNIIVGLGGTNNSIPREAGYDITVASEVMAVFCLTQSLEGVEGAAWQDHRGLHARTEAGHGRRPEGQRRDGRAVEERHQAEPRADAGKQSGVHPRRPRSPTSPTAATACWPRSYAMRLSEYTVTEAGFGADLGAEKFLNIKCRKSGLKPNAVVIVATVRALKLHGGVPLKELGKPNVEALDKGVENLKKHIENIHRFGLPVVVAINHFSTPTPKRKSNSSRTSARISRSRSSRPTIGPRAAPAPRNSPGRSSRWSTIRRPTSRSCIPTPARFGRRSASSAARFTARPTFWPTKNSATSSISCRKPASDNLPICMAKTQYSLSTDPLLVGRPKAFDVPLRDVMVSAGAGFVVVLTGDIMTMPGLPKVPAAESIDIDENEQILGLF